MPALPSPPPNPPACRRPLSSGSRTICASVISAPAAFRGPSSRSFGAVHLVHNSVQGLADIERKVAVKDDTIFRIYSMTKPITSVAFMMLVEEGRVALEEPVHRYIPEWENFGVFRAGMWPAFLTRPTSKPMQIVDLMRHTSGLTYGFQQCSNVDAAYRELKIGELEKPARCHP